MTPTNSNRVFWYQVMSLMALDLAVIISWMAYHEYQPQLILQFGYENHILELLVLQGIILLVTPPVAGLITDRLRQKRGVRLPVVNLGVNFVAMVFMSVAFTVYMEPSGWILNAFPVMIALWLIAMNLFHSPAISTVELFVPASKLPQVMAVFVVTADLCQALEPSLTDIIQKLTAPVTFAIGGVFVLATGWWFMTVVKKFETSGESVPVTEAGKNVKDNFLLVALLGVLMGAAITLFFNVFPAWVNTKLEFLAGQGISGNVFISILAALSAVSALFMGNFAERFGTMKMLFAGVIACTLLGLGAWYIPGNASLVCFMLYPIAVSMITVCALPIAFVNLSVERKVLGVGIFFSGLSLAESALAIWANS